MSTALEPIKKWSVRHEMIVHMHIAQYSNSAIAEHFNITPVRVSQVLSDPQAKQIIRAVRNNLRQTLAENVEGKLLLLAEESVDRIGETIEFRDFVLGSDAKKHQDNLSLGLLKGVGFLSGDKEGNGKVEKQIPPALAERLITALEASNEAARIQNSTDVLEAEIVEEAEGEGTDEKLPELASVND